MCFIKNDKIIGKFKDVTSGWQPLPSKPKDITVVNSRRDDVAYIRNTHGGIVCIAPKSSYSTGWTLNAVRISSNSSCG
ncbi:hypothetical protein GCM10009544_04640 [Streptomyces stramineus]|uniref:Uncharacterized protein n=1 Tax=Streptomyces stramineus TaxID=173861 RepID=A0ABP3J7Q7_9ACTN